MQSEAVKEAITVFQKLLDYECWDGDWMLKLQDAAADGHLETVVKAAQSPASAVEVTLEEFNDVQDGHKSYTSAEKAIQAKWPNGVVFVTRKTHKPESE